VRTQLLERANAQGWPALHQELAQVDPLTAARLNPNDAQRISRALEVNISWFFTPEGPADRAGQYVVRRDARRHISFAEGIDDYQLNSLAVRQMGLLYSTFAPGASSGESPYAHEGEEAGLVVAGKFELWIDGLSILLDTGDSFSFPSSRPLRYRNPGRAKAVVVWAMTPPTY
jgi:quercetin dioxygenase-like cupin family protein